MDGELALVHAVFSYDGFAYALELSSVPAAGADRAAQTMKDVIDSFA